MLRLVTRTHKKSCSVEQSSSSALPISASSARTPALYQKPFRRFGPNARSIGNGGPSEQAVNDDGGKDNAASSRESVQRSPGRRPERTLELPTKEAAWGIGLFVLRVI